MKTAKAKKKPVRKTAGTSLGAKKPRAKIRLREKNPTVTIVTPSFNQGKFIERTIRSVLSQKYPHLEYIVVDGGSTDETLQVLKKYEKHLRWISERDSGQSEAVNKGFHMAKGEIVAWLNSDDIYLPGALKKVGRYFADHPDVMMVYGEGYMIDETDNVKCRFPFTVPKYDLSKLIYYGDYILQQSTFFRRTMFDTIELLREDLHYGMDWDLFIRIGKRFRVDYIPEYLGCIREHGEAKTITGGRKRFRELVSIIRKHGHLRYPQSYFNYAWNVYGSFLRTHDDASIDGKSSSGKVRPWVKRSLQRLLSVYQKRFDQGYYQDGWVGKTAVLVLPNLHPLERDQYLLMIAETYSPNIPFNIAISINSATVARLLVEQSGLLKKVVKVPESFTHSDCYHVELRSSKTFRAKQFGQTADTRDLGFQLKSIDMSPERI